MSNIYGTTQKCYFTKCCRAFCPKFFFLISVCLLHLPFFFSGHQNWVLCVTWAPDGKKIASGCKNGQVSSNVQTREARATHATNGSVKSLAPLVVADILVGPRDGEAAGTDALRAQGLDHVPLLGAPASVGDATAFVRIGWMHALLRGLAHLPPPRTLVHCPGPGAMVPGLPPLSVPFQMPCPTRAWRKREF